MPRLVLLQASGFGAGRLHVGLGSRPRPGRGRCCSTCPSLPASSPGARSRDLSEGPRVHEPRARGWGVGRGGESCVNPQLRVCTFFFFFFFASQGYSRSACASDETRPAAWRALGLGPGSGHARGLTCPEPRRRSPESPPPAGRGCSRRLGEGEGGRGCWGCPPRPHGGAQRTCFLTFTIREPASNSVLIAECLQKVPHGSAPPHRPCYTCFKEEETEVLGCWVTCLRFPSGSGVSSQELGISYYLRPWASPLSSLDSSFPVYKMMIIKFALCTYLAT
ncbi:unnamed protein product [Nyctereutes procyonoides]|uniref:(raccoon dog) hypothetical protein n=1 Tax=Nyctereutes procyonoides TaxID=34880 RepID=A0A811YPY9_NYCPR|nr:unnamed protein product [Nyctereutes procyonoides]